MVLPDGFAFPPIPYLVVLLVGCLGVGLWVVRTDPPVTATTVLALTPWMALGGGLHAADVLGIVPGPLSPFLGTPAVYVSTAILAGVVWAVARSTTPDRSDRTLGIVGAAGFALVASLIVRLGVARGDLAPTGPAAALAVAVALSAAVWLVLDRRHAPVTAVTAGAGIAVIFGHTLDALTTAIGVDYLDAGERSPLPRAIMELAGSLPTADVLGVGWLFVLVKIAIAVAIVWLFVPFVRETERQGYFLLGLIAAVGLGPGVHNLLLFVVSG